MNHFFRITCSLFILLLSITCCRVRAQQLNCSFSTPVVNIDFGNAASAPAEIAAVRSYRKAKNDCPDDGRFSLTPFTYGCFGGKWHNLVQDHTPGDANGRMMVVNASEKPGMFFTHTAAGLTPGSLFEFSVWLVNICRMADGCTPTPPYISISITASGRLIGSFETGLLLPAAEPKWQRFFGTFRMPPDAADITITMDDITRGGCGNDFAMDDLVIKECRPVQAAKQQPKPVPAANAPQENSNAAPPGEMVLKPAAAKPAVKEPVKRSTAPGAPAGNRPVNIEKNATATIPKPLVTRANPVVQQIETTDTELLIELYDNGEIDGDTISIYHNSQLVVSRAALSAVPVRVSIKVDKDHPRHELVMVAENLGAIPPNTSLMIATVNGKRYEVFISSSEEKNARILITRKE